MTNDDIDGNTSKTPSNKEAWLNEIIRETEHYFQGELQHEQRASWLLATTVVLLTLLVSLEIGTLRKFSNFTQFLLVTALIIFVVSAIISVFTMLPLHGTRIWKDAFGDSYRRYRTLEVDQLIQERFHNDTIWSTTSFEQRIKYHFRSHYLRFHRKAYGILWASTLLLLGVLLFTVMTIHSLF